MFTCPNDPAFIFNVFAEIPNVPVCDKVVLDRIGPFAISILSWKEICVLSSDAICVPAKVKPPTVPVPADIFPDTVAPPEMFILPLPVILLLFKSNAPPSCGVVSDTTSESPPVFATQS